MGGGRRQDRLSFRESVSAFLQLVVEKRDVQATKPSIFSIGIVKRAYQNVKRGRFIDL